MSGILNVLPATFSSKVPTVADFGTAAELSSGTFQEIFSCGTASSSVYLCFYSELSTDDIYATKVTISGSSITSVLTPVNIIASGGVLRSVTQIGTTSTAFLVYTISNTLYAVVVDYSGSTPSLGTPVTVDTSVNVLDDKDSSVSFDNSNVLVCYYKSSTMTYRVLSVSGTTLTLESITSGEVQDDRNALVFVNSTTALAVSTNNVSDEIKARVVTLSAGAVTEGTIYTLFSSETGTLTKIEIAPAGSSRYYCSWYSDGVINYALLTLSGSEVTATSKETGDSSTRNALVGTIKTSSTINFVNSTDILAQELLNNSGTVYIKSPKLEDVPSGLSYLHASKIDSGSVFLAYTVTSGTYAVVVDIT